MNYLATPHKDSSLIGRIIFKTDLCLTKCFQGSVPLSPMMTNLDSRGVLRLQVLAKVALRIQSTVVDCGPDWTRSRGSRGSKYTTRFSNLMQRSSLSTKSREESPRQCSWSTSYLQCPKLPPLWFHIKGVLWLPKGLCEMLNERVNTLNERGGPNDLKSPESLKLWFYI